MKILHEMNKAIKYQIRLGGNNLDIYCKVQYGYDYTSYVKVNLTDIDPNEKVKDWDKQKEATYSKGWQIETCWKRQITNVEGAQRKKMRKIKISDWSSFTDFLQKSRQCLII